MTLDADAFADLLTGYCVDVQPGEQVLVRTTSLAAPLVVALQRSILQRDAWPLMRVEVPGQARGFYAHARPGQLDGVSEVAEAEARGADKFIAVQAPDDVRALADVDPARIAAAARAGARLREIRMGKRWCSSLWPTPAGAQRAGLELDAFEAFVARALFLDADADAGADAEGGAGGAESAWGRLRDFQQGLIERLRTARTIRIEAEGTDVTLDVGGRTWVNSDGRRNMPSGEVFTGPREDSADGVIRFDVPSSPAGVDVRGVRLELRAGVVVSASADAGEDYLREALQTDGGAARLGELGIGTNFGIDRAIGAILFDEKIGGTVHLALGRSYPETGGVNESALHWDLICDLRAGGRITADGDVIQQDGRFV